MSQYATRRDRRVTARGLRLHNLDWGNPGLPPMLLLHGLQDCAACWDFFAPRMRDRYHVLALDHRGHGDSPWAPEGSYRLADYVGELEETIEALGLRNLTLIGHSAGGKNAFIYASRYPDRLAKLVIVDMDPDALNPGSASMFQRYRAESDEWPDLDAVVERLRSREPRAPEETLRHHAEALTRPGPGPIRVWKRDRAVVLRYERPDAWDCLPRIRCPTLIVRGGISTLLTHPVALRMQERIPQCQLVELPGTGHWCYDEDPEGFHEAVSRFLQQDA